MTQPAKKEVVRVYFNDSSFKTFAIQEDTSAAELCEMFAKKMSLKGATVSRHFSLYIVVDGVRM